jgi:predicted outer membrane repeat protein
MTLILISMPLIVSTACVFGAKAFDKFTGVKISCRELIFVFLTLFPAPGAAVTQALAGQSSIQVVAHTSISASISMVAVDTVTSWAQLVTACAAPSVNITLSPAFKMGAYTNEIDFSGKVIIIFGSNTTFDAGQKGSFFSGDGSKGQTSLELHGITLKNGKVDGNGGAIAALSGANVEIHTSSFTLNEAPGGGAIHANGGANLEIYASQFISNDAYYSEGGAIYIYQGTMKIHDSTFESNTAGNSIGYGGGAICITDANVEIYDSAFEVNTALDYGGGAIFAYDDANVEIYTSTFESNSALDGGAIAAVGGVNVEIHTSSFISNKALQGGAIVVYRGTLEIYDSTFESNQASDSSSGAIFVDGSLAAFNCTFHGNTAPAGGAVYVWNGAIATFTGCIFNGNDGTTGHNDITRRDDTSNVTFACANGTVGAPVTMKAGESEITNPPPTSLKCTASRYVCHRPGTVPGQCVVVPTGGVSLKDCVEACT